MKTLKFAMVAVILSVAMMGYADNWKNNYGKQRVIEITLKEALTHPSLVCAMYEQLTPAKLIPAPFAGYAVGVVKVRHIRFDITGTKDEWRKFFLNEPADKRIKLAY
jgi:hypothetical protein